MCTHPCASQSTLWLRKFNQCPEAERRPHTAHISAHRRSFSSFSSIKRLDRLKTILFASSVLSKPQVLVPSNEGPKTRPGRPFHPHPTIENAHLKGRPSHALSAHTSIRKSSPLHLPLSASSSHHHPQPPSIAPPSSLSSSPAPPSYEEGLVIESRTAYSLADTPIP